MISPLFPSPLFHFTLTSRETVLVGACIISSCSTLNHTTRESANCDVANCDVANTTPKPTRFALASVDLISAIEEFNNRCYYCFQTLHSCQRNDENGYRMLDRRPQPSCRHCYAKGRICHDMTESQRTLLARRCRPCRCAYVKGDKCSDVSDRPCPRCKECDIVCEPYIPGGMK